MLKREVLWDMSLAEKAIFTYAFKLGARLTYESLCDNTDLV